MRATLIYDDRTSSVANATQDAGGLWLTFDDVESATGWNRKPEGLCKGDACVPIPPARKAEFVSGDDRRLNLAAFARYLGQPVVRDDASGTWAFGEAPAARRERLRSLDAPDFRLPDLDGTVHALSDYRGKKVLLLSWASW